LSLRQTRQKSKTEKALEQAQQDLLDTQELAASQFEQNQQLQASLLDTQELVASIVEKGGTV